MGFAADTLDSVCITFDKMDKIGAEGVKAELTEKQLPETAINALADFIAAGDVTLESVASRCADPAIADDLKYVLTTAKAMANGRFDVAYCPSLVRGQGYYTGMVFEITCPQFSGAVAGGGRYDNMVGKFLGVQVPAVGFSIGFERVCGILLEQGYQIPGAKQKIALLYGKDTDFPAVLRKAAALREKNAAAAAQSAGAFTVIAEDGGNISQGQKQLLCIARVMLCLPPMLILDEATSSIDTRTEVRIQAAFARMMQGRTSFIVAHRLSTIREADVILVMKDGHIVEQGDHDTLLAQGGFYAKLYNSQFEGVET